MARLPDQDIYDRNKTAFPPLHDINEVAGEIGLDATAALVHETAREKGFWPERYYLVDTKVLHSVVEQGGKGRILKVSEEAICTKLALIHSEVTEILEAVRKDKGKEAVLEEMADVHIRLLDLYAALRNTEQVDGSLDEVVQSKMRKNSNRPRLHGNKF